MDRVFQGLQFQVKITVPKQLLHEALPLSHLMLRLLLLLTLLLGAQAKPRTYLVETAEGEGEGKGKGQDFLSDSEDTFADEWTALRSAGDYQDEMYRQAYETKKGDDYGTRDYVPDNVTDYVPKTPCEQIGDGITGC